MKLAVGVLASVLLFTPVSAKGAFKCDGSQRKVENDYVSMPCTFTFGIWPLEKKFDFVIRTKECENEFSVTSTIKGKEYTYHVTEDDNEITLHNYMLCSKIAFEQIQVSEDGISFCPKFPGCSLISEQPCAVLAAEDSCQHQTDCSSCAAKSNCGWCYSTESCLPINDDKTLDRCGLCEDFTPNQCTDCTDNCNGHGSCSDHQCTCETGWSGAPANCDIYSPTKEMNCVHLFFTRANIDMSTNVNGYYYGYLSLMGPRVSHITVWIKGNEKPTLLFRLGGLPPTMEKYDFIYDSTKSPAENHVGESTHECQDDDVAGGRTLIFSAELPPLAHSEEIWVGTKTPGLELSVDLGMCEFGFYGVNCEMTASHIDPSFVTDVSKIVERHPHHGNVVKTYHMPVALRKGSKHYILFRVDTQITKIKVALEAPDLSESDKSALDSAVKMDFLRNGKEVEELTDSAEILEPEQSHEWELVVKLDANYKYDFARFKVAFYFTQWDESNISFMDEITDTPLPDGLKRYVATNLQLPEKMPWIYTILKVPFGAVSLEITMKTQLASPQLFARYRARPVIYPHGFTRAVAHQVSSHGDNLKVKDPEPGYWYIGILEPNRPPASTHPQVNLTVDVKYCDEDDCDINHCRMDTEVPATKCEVSSCSESGAQAVIPRCDLNWVGFTNPPPETPNNSPNTTPSKSSGGNNTMVGLIIGLLGGVVGVLALAGGAHILSVLNMKREQRKRERGAYDSISAVPTLDIEEHNATPPDFIQE